MNCLLIDTSCPTAVVALCINGHLVAKRYLTHTKQHSEFLSPCVGEVLTQGSLRMEDLNLVAVGKGPGSFIGVRIAMAYAKGLCVALGIPLVGVGTLSSIASAPGICVGTGVAVIDARRGEYYVQTFERSADGQTTAIDLPHLYPAQDIGKLAAEHSFVIGTSLHELESSTTTIYPIDGPSAEGMLEGFRTRLSQSNGLDETATLVPDYVRDPDAKPMPV